MSAFVDAPDASVDASDGGERRQAKPVTLMRLEAVWLSVSVLVFGVVGAVWGLLRPRYTLNVLEGGHCGGG